MPFVNPNDLFNHEESCEASLLDTNWQTTAAVGLAVATGGVTGAIMLAAFPAQTIGAAATIGGLAYAGKNRADGKSPFPFMDKKSDDKSDDVVSKKSEPQAQAA